METEGTLYLKPEFALNQNDSHPNKVFANRLSPHFCERIIEVIETIKYRKSKTN